jgi:hypothetical protein
VRIEPEIVSVYRTALYRRTQHRPQKLHERTLANLYNQRPQWLIDSHRDLDAAIAAAYGWPADITPPSIVQLKCARISNAQGTIP